MIDEHNRLIFINNKILSDCMNAELKGFYKGKSVLVTGHTGFKGAWLSLVLSELGAKVIGYSLDPKTKDDLFTVAELKKRIKDIRGDIRNPAALKKVFDAHKPEIVFHLAAQALVRDSYEMPVETFQTNVQGTVNVLEAIRQATCVKSAVIITSDKCYKN